MFLVQIVHVCFTIYTFMIFLRIFASWVPELARMSFMLHVYEYTDPYLNFFRSVIPPLGLLDLSPMAALISLQFLERFVLSLLII